MENLDFKEKARILNNELAAYGTKLKHGQALNILAKIEGYKTYADYKKETEQKDTHTIEIDKEIWNDFVSKREDFGVPIEIQLETLIEQELYQTNDGVKLYKYEDENFDTYLVFAKSKGDAFSIIDSGWLPAHVYAPTRVKEVSLEILYGMMIRNTWKGIDSYDGMYNIYESEVVEVEGSGTSCFPKTLIEYKQSLETMEFEYHLVPNHNDEEVLKLLKKEKQKDPENFSRYMELRKIVLETDKKVKGK